MTKENFHKILQAAVTGEHRALEEIFELYEPLITKYSYIDGSFDEDTSVHTYSNSIKNF